MYDELREENLQYQKRIESSDYNGQLSTEIGRMNSGMRYVGVMRVGYSQEHTKSRGLQERLDFQRSTTQTVLLPNTREILDGCSGAV
jgi:hypothetical protein